MHTTETEKQYTCDDIKRWARAGLKNYQIVFKDALKTPEFKKLTTAQRTNAARVLVKMGDVAANPDKYFSYAATEPAWAARRKQCFLENRRKTVKEAYQTASKPETEIIEMVKSLPDFIPGTLTGDYKQFVTAIRKYEYSCACKYKTQPKEYVDIIVGLSAKIALHAHRVQSARVMRPIYNLLYSWEYN